MGIRVLLRIIEGKLLSPAQKNELYFRLGGHLFYKELFKGMGGTRRESSADMLLLKHEDLS